MNSMSKTDKTIDRILVELGALREQIYIRYPRRRAS